MPKNIPLLRFSLGRGIFFYMHTTCACYYLFNSYNLKLILPNFRRITVPLRCKQSCSLVIVYRESMTFVSICFINDNFRTFAFKINLIQVTNTKPLLHPCNCTQYFNLFYMLKFCIIHNTAAFTKHVLLTL